MPLPAVFYGSKNKADYFAGRGGYTLTAKFNPNNPYNGHVEQSIWGQYRDAGHDCIVDEELREYIILTTGCIELVKLSRHQ